MAGTADCSSQIESDGAVFTSYGFTERDGIEFAVAREAVCEDVGDDARGSVFTENSRSVVTYRFAGHSPSRVLGVRQGEVDVFAVFVADSVEHADRERIYEELGRAKP